MRLSVLRAWMASLSLAALLGCSSSTPPDTGGPADASVPSDAASRSDAGADAAAAALTFVTSPAPAMATLRGLVVDESGTPIPDATIDLGTGTTTRSANDGGFALQTATGRLTVTVTATGRVPWKRQVGITGAPPPLRVRLAARGADQTVPAAGATIAAGTASLQYAAGAYASDTTVSATWLDRTNIESWSNSSRWLDAGGGMHKVLGVLHVEAPSEPAQPVTVRVPIPAGVTNVAYYPFAKDGTREAAIAPSSVSNGFATFAVPHFDDGETDDESPAPEADVVSGTATLDPPVGPPVTVHQGDAVPSGSKLFDTPSGVLVITPSGVGNLITDGQVTFDFGPDRGVTMDCDDCTVHVTEPPVKRAPYLIRTRSAVMGVRGTVLTVRDHPCPSGDPRTITFVEVSEGAVDVTSGGATTAVNAGSEAKACEGCADPRTPTCCDAKNCGTGCCSADDTCMDGTSADACGNQGFVCQACGTGSGCTVDRNCAACGQPGENCCAASTCVAVPWLGHVVQPVCGPRGTCCMPPGTPTDFTPDMCCSGQIDMTPQARCL